MSLDSDAQRFLRLLRDPCRADLTGAPYGGIAGTNYFRFRSVVFPGAGAVDAICQFCPSLVGAQGSSSAGIGAIQWASSNTGGASPGTLYGTQISSNFGGTFMGSVRCVGACIRVLYTGSELNRAGLVGTSITTTPIYNGAGTNAGVSVSTPAAAIIQVAQPHVERLGEVLHEVRWVPAFEDQNFVDLYTYPNAPNNFAPVTGSAIVASVVGAPAGQFQFEVITCWEACPTAAGGVVTSMSAPRSSNTLNEILRVIGNVTDFAVNAGNIIVPAIRSGLTLARTAAPAIAAAVL